MSKKHEGRENDDSPYFTAVIAAVLASAVVGKQGEVTKEDAIRAYRDMLQTLRQGDVINP